MNGIWEFTVLATVLGFTVSAGAAQDRVTLVNDGKAAAVIVLPEKSAPDEEFAAKEIQEHIEKMSGAKLEIVSKDATDGRASIRLGAELSPDAAAELNKKSSDNDAIIVTVAPAAQAGAREPSGVVSVVGNSPEGTLFAAYEVLERLGCRWYLPGDLGTVIPKNKTIVLMSEHTLKVPSFPSRHLQGVGTQDPWYRRQRLGGAPFAGGHGITGLPDFKKGEDDACFALVHGVRRGPQMCVSNPEVLKRAVAHALAVFDADPSKMVIGMGPADGSGFCECDECKKLDSGEWDPLAAEPSVTDRYIWFFNKVLDEVHKKYPDKQLSFYVYHTYQMPPSKVKPSPFIVPGLAPITLCRVHGMSNPICPDRSYYRKLMTDWCKLLPNVYERGYFFNLACPQFPFSKIHAVRDEIPIAYEAGLKGWRVECMNCWPATGPTEYVASRLMWDVHADVDAMMREFANGVFGPAAEPMGGYLKLVDDGFRDTDCHTGGSFVMMQVFTPARMAKATELLDNAKKLAASDPLYAKRVMVFRLNHDRLAAFLQMIGERDRFDFVAAKKSLDRLLALGTELAGVSLGDYDSGKNGMKPFPAYDSRYPEGYVKRFWVPAVQSGFDRLAENGELVAGFPDVWDFLIDPRDLGEAMGWSRDGKIGGDWQPLKTVSASWSDQGLHYYKGLAWYRTSVTIPKEFAGRKIFLWFGGVDEKAKVWVNGKLVGSTDAANVGKPENDLPGVAGTFKPFELDVTSAVRAGEANTVAVKITNNVLNELGTGGIVSPVMFWSPKAK